MPNSVLQIDMLALFSSSHHCLICVVIPGGLCTAVHTPLLTPACSRTNACARVCVCVYGRVCPGQPTVFVSEKCIQCIEQGHFLGENKCLAYVTIGPMVLINCNVWLRECYQSHLTGTVKGLHRILLLLLLEEDVLSVSSHL